MLDACDEHNLVVIASLMWNVHNFADPGPNSLADGIKDRNSPGRRKVEEYIRAVVNRYKGRRTIVMWELGNARNLRLFKRIADGIGKPLLVGEIGLHAEVPRFWDKPEAISLLKKTLPVLVELKIPLTLYWTYADDRAMPVPRSTTCAPAGRTRPWGWWRRRTRAQGEGRQPPGRRTGLGATMVGVSSWLLPPATRAGG